MFLKKKKKSQGDKVPIKKIMQFSMFSRFTFEQLQWIIPVTEKSLSELCEGRILPYINFTHAIVFQFLNCFHLKKGLTRKVVNLISLCYVLCLILFCFVVDLFIASTTHMHIYIYACKRVYHETQ